jgi:hypothetical protein
MADAGDSKVCRPFSLSLDISMPAWVFSLFPTPRLILFDVVFVA